MICLTFHLFIEWQPSCSLEHLRSDRYQVSPQIRVSPDEVMDLEGRRIREVLSWGLEMGPSTAFEVGSKFTGGLAASGKRIYRLIDPPENPARRSIIAAVHHKTESEVQ